MANPTKTPKTAGQRLKSLRESHPVAGGKRLTQEMLAQEIGWMQNGRRKLSSVHLGNIENDRREMSLKYAVLFARYFGVNVDWLLYGTGFKTEEEAKAAAQEERAKYVLSVLDVTKSVKQLMCAILKAKGYSLNEIPADVGCSIDTHVYQVSDKNGNIVVFQDDGLADRILHYAELEMSAFLASALTAERKV